MAHAIAAAAAEAAAPLLAQAMYWRLAPRRALRAGGVPTYRDIEAAVDTLAQLVEQQREPRAGVPDLGRRPPIVATATSRPASCSSRRACRS